MVSVLSKPSDRIDLEDICSLISEQVPEGTQIEYKECLPSRDGRSDPWSRGEKTIGDYAMQEILDEVVAVANDYGGALVFGLAEDGTQPPVAARLSPVPNCADLAARFRHVFRDRVEPPLPMLEVAPVQTEGEQGTIVFRTARSRRGPHRVNRARNLWKCPIRRPDRCEAMGMREIYDMTLSLARGAERLQRRFHDRSRKFQDEFKKLQSPEDAFGIRVSAIPVGDDVRLESVFSAGRLIDALRPPEVGMTRITERESIRLRTTSSIPKSGGRSCVALGRKRSAFPSIVVSNSSISRSIATTLSNSVLWAIAFSWTYTRIGTGTSWTMKSPSPCSTRFCFGRGLSGSTHMPRAPSMRFKSR